MQTKNNTVTLTTEPDAFARPDETLATAINRIMGRHRGDTYQDGVAPGACKLMQFADVCNLRQVPPIGAQPGHAGENLIAHVKLFDPCGSWTWYITEWDSSSYQAFGFVKGDFPEMGYFSLEELADFKGRFNIGLEIDMHWRPRPLSKCGLAPVVERL